jgi:hypothetical protein
MTLLERCQSLQDKRNRLVSLHSNTQETTALQSHASKLKDAHTEFSRAVEVRRALLAENVTLPTLEHQKVQEVTEALGRIRGRFTKDPIRQALVTGNDWPVLTDGMKGLLSYIKSSCRQGWQDYMDDFFARTDIVENKVAKTDTNIACLKEYKKLFGELKALASDWDRIESVRTFKTKGKRLLELAQELNNFHAPDDVKKFLEAVSTNGGAPLDFLTDEVVVWLKEQKMFSKYKIVGGY